MNSDTTHLHTHCLSTICDHFRTLRAMQFAAPHDEARSHWLSHPRRHQAESELKQIDIAHGLLPLARLSQAYAGTI